MDNLSKPELLTLLSIMEGELEARDLVIEALRVSWAPFKKTQNKTKTKPSHDLFALRFSSQLQICREVRTSSAALV